MMRAKRNVGSYAGHNYATARLHALVVIVLSDLVEKKRSEGHQQKGYAEMFESITKVATSN